MNRNHHEHHSVPPSGGDANAARTWLALLHLQPANFTDPGILERVVELASHADPSVQAEALRTLKQFPVAELDSRFDLLCPHLRNPDYVVRLNAIRLVESIDTEEAKRLLRSMTDDPVRVVREYLASIRHKLDC